MNEPDWDRLRLQGALSGARGIEKRFQRALLSNKEADVTHPNPATANNPRPPAGEEGFFPPPQLPREFKLAMQRARVTAGLSQMDLARRVSEKQSVVNAYESGKAAPNANIISKLERALNCRLPRPERY